MDEEFSDIQGRKLTLQQRSYSRTCREFNITCPKLSLRSLTTSTCTIWLIAYAIFAYTQNNIVLSAAILCTFIGLLFYLHFVKIDQESLLVIGSLGIQMTLSFASGKESTECIEIHRVKDVVINEAIFMSSKPKLDCLVEIYRSCQDILSQKEPVEILNK
ncbi:phosphatidylinositol N-acetylglucosaminyltransferase subunit H isoform X2 [Spea bombifrons]|uniref:phosphatidylinositol N-acetylglucosaminyltransferase subunit H isoform X2 n=1 Tax=Spea bombifrons TaxID=233779 RepID=UPI00234C01E8|nr:phosphatidylinositol N-acetylglucosaminyltransferase subunit H isoform X2 [Spea bombifrons]